MIRNRLLSIALACAALSLTPGWDAAMADEIRLHSGDTFQGRLLEETAEHYRFEVHVSQAIRETRVFPRADVAELHRQTPAERAFGTLQERMPPGDRLTLEDYDELLAMANAFLEEHGGSPQAQQARQFVATLNEEREQVAEGSIKVAGEWHSAEDQQRHRYDFNAMVLAEELREQLEQENYLEALRTFDTLLTDYPRSTHMIDSIPAARQAMEQLKPIIDRLILDNPVRVERREQSKLGLPADQLARLERGIAAEEASFAARLEAEQAAGIRWKSYSAMNIDSLEATRDRIQETAELLDNKDVAELRQSAERFAEGMALLQRARDLMDEKRFTEALDRVQEAQDMGAPQENVTAVREEIAAARAPAEMPVIPPPPADSTLDDLDQLAGNPLRDAMRDQHAEAEAERQRQQAMAADQAEADEAARAEQERQRQQAMAEAAQGEPAETEPTPDVDPVEADPEVTEIAPDSPADDAATPATPETETATDPEPAATVATTGADDSDSTAATTPPTDGQPTAAEAEAEEDSGFASMLNMIILGLAGIMVVLIVVMKVTDLGAARRENARREKELAEREEAAKAEEEQRAREEAEAEAAEQAAVAAGTHGKLSLEELEAQAAADSGATSEEPSADAEAGDANDDEKLQQQPETHTAPVPQPTARVSPPVPRS